MTAEEILGTAIDKLGQEIRKLDSDRKPLGDTVTAVLKLARARLWVSLSDNERWAREMTNIHGHCGQ